jgi:predicted hydrocarbon binding protein
MENVFLDTNDHKAFLWESMGDIGYGRGGLGEEMPVLVYRLMQYTLMDVLCDEFGMEKANACFKRAGFLAGMAFVKNMLDLSLPFNEFIGQLQCKFKELKIGILRMEAFDEVTGEITLTVNEDLDCSGLPVNGEFVCVYDEGLIAAVLQSYTGREYNVS